MYNKWATFCIRVIHSTIIEVILKEKRKHCFDMAKAKKFMRIFFMKTF